MAVAPWADSVTSILSCRAAIVVVAAAIDNKDLYYQFELAKVGPYQGQQSRLAQDLLIRGLQIFRSYDMV
ncbi:hypothetical protein L195_g037812 [Trifolium pratense]|uniref:Uncharacterized protein n=1 Tax=Trifolium pratense TaxID=57577 RepID=A0A2K3LTD9_TRIPR|nr:hypothetical protein L195_g037812 [Trifolium pratense]